MRFKKTIFLILIFICFCVASFFAGIKYNNNQNLNQDKKYYLNQLYGHLDSTLHLLSSVDDWGTRTNNTDITANTFRQLLAELDYMKAINEQAQLYMINGRDSYFLENMVESFRLIEDSIGSGISNICDDFLKDGILSKNEISFLNSLKQDLQNMENNLSSETEQENIKQENQSLTMKQVAIIVKPFTDKYSTQNLLNLGLKN